MKSRFRSAVADVVVAVVVLIVVIWLLRRVIGIVFWLASLLALGVVVVALLAFARWVRKG